MKMNYKSMLFRNDERISRNWFKIASVILLVFSLSFLIAYFVSSNIIERNSNFLELSWGSLFLNETFYDTYGVEILEKAFFAVPESVRDFRGSLPIIVLIIASIGFLSFGIVTIVDGTMVLENRSWIRDMKRKGLITEINTLNNMVISTKVGDVIISKSGVKYKIELPKILEFDMSKFGLTSKNNSLICSCSKKEMTGIIHIFLSKIS